MDKTRQQNELVAALEELYRSETYSDLTVISGDKQYRVHKAIVCPRSAFFAAACSGHFEEAKTSIISLPDDDPQAVQMMMHYFYHLDYPHVFPHDDGSEEKQLAKGGSPQNLVIHAGVYALAEKYCIEGLKLLCLEKFKNEVEIHWNTNDFLRPL